MDNEGTLAGMSIGVQRSLFDRLNCRVDDIRVIRYVVCRRILLRLEYTFQGDCEERVAFVQLQLATELDEKRRDETCGRVKLEEGRTLGT